MLKPFHFPSTFSAFNAADAYTDTDHDGLPDWFELYWFGNLNQTASSLDTSGNTLLSDYQNGYEGESSLDVIQFSIDSTNYYVSHTNVTLQLTITAGVPGYYAVVINGGTTTNWLTFSTTNLPVNLGTTDGVYDVHIGLRGSMFNPSQTWEDATLTVDRVAPVVVITNPVSGTVDVPMIQLEGYASKTLAGIFFDVSNAVGVVSNQQGFVTGQYYDTNLWRLTTNYFQCFDIALTTNGLNTVTLRATDLAGNMTTLTTNFTVSYADRTNLPAFTLGWPQDGMQVSGNSFTLVGRLADYTATVSATVTDTNGDTAGGNGVVERDGTFWLDNLPLAAGTNTVALTVTDAAGNTSTTNITVCQSAVTLTMDTISDPSQLWNPTIDVSGTISGGDGYTVWVNGVQVTAGGGSWSGTVPVNTGGVADFNVTAYPSGHNPSGGSGGGGSGSGGGAQNPADTGAATYAVSIDKPARLYVGSDTQNMDSYEHSEQAGWWTDGDTNLADAYGGYETWTTNHFDAHWTNDLGGGGSALYNLTYQDVGGGGGTNYFYTEQMTWPGTNWENFEQTDGTGLFAGNDCGATPTNTPVGIPPLALGMVDIGYGGDLVGYYFTGEHCEETDPETSYSYGQLGNWGSDWELLEDDQTYERHAQTTMELQPGGRAVPGRRSLFQISGWAKDLAASWSKRAVPSYARSIYGDGLTELYYAPVLPYATTKMGSLGTLGNDGNLWVTLPDGDTPVDVTPQTGKPFYLFGAGQQKYKLKIQVNGTTRLSPIGVVRGANYCVGQKLTFSTYWLPNDPPYIESSSFFHWHLSGTFVNNYIPDTYWSEGSGYYTNDASLLANEATSAWWVSGGTNANTPAIYTASVGINLLFQNGQNVSIAALGQFNMYRPSIDHWDLFNYGSPQVMIGSGCLEAGNYINNTDGMSFNAYIQSKYSGKVEFTQLIYGDYIWDYSINIDEYELAGC